MNGAMASKRVARGAVIEHIHPNPFVVRGGQKPIAGTEAGTYNSQIFITLLLQPVEAGPDIDYGLSGGIDRTRDVR
jgi:hypothetical protein